MSEVRIQRTIDDLIAYDEMYLSHILERSSFAGQLLREPKELPQGDGTIDHEDRFIGCMLGVAVGDAAGRPVEGFTPEQIKQVYGKVTGYMEPQYIFHPAEQIPSGYYSDDTEMTLDVAKCLAENGYLDPQRLLFMNSSYMIRGGGSAVYRALHYYRHGIPWYDCGLDYPYNGGPMKASPVGLLNFYSAKKLKIETILSTWTTHINSQAIAGAIVQAYAAAYLVNSKPELFNKKDRGIAFINAIASSVEGLERPEDIRLSMKRNSKQAVTDENAFAGIAFPTIYDRVKNRLAEMLDLHGDDPLKVFNTWGTGVKVYESVPSALYCFLRSPLDFEEILFTAVNGGKDCDSTASMSCALCGALLGYKGIPEKYIQGLCNAEQIIELAKKLYRTSMKIRKA